MHAQSWRNGGAISLDKQYADYPCVNLLDSTSVTVEPTGQGSFAVCRAVRVQTTAGALQQRVLKYDYDPLTAAATFKRVTIYHADGTYTSVDVSKACDYAAPARAIYWGARQIMLELGALPIINENDSVDTDEITSIGDNDTLAAIVTCCIKADLLVLLSDIDGLYTANPHTHPDAKLIPLVEDITPEVMALADGAGSALGTGGMSTKLRAARMVTSSGADMVIANGAHPELLKHIAANRAAGTS